MADGQFVRANDLDLYFEEDGEGEPLILIHGAFSTSSSWAATVPIFARHFRVIMPDSRGHGRTANPKGELSYRMMADDMAAFIDVLGLRKPLIAGWSDGGQIGLELGMHYLDLASAYVVGGAFYKFSKPYRQAITALGIEGPGQLNAEAIRATFGLWNAEIEALALQLSVPFWTEPNYSAADFARIAATRPYRSIRRSPCIGRSPRLSLPSFPVPTTYSHSHARTFSIRPCWNFYCGTVHRNIRDE